jgi:hypothetical protein
MAIGLGPSYTFDELAEIWFTNGGNHPQTEVAAAIALAESGGCRYALAGPVDVRPVPECRFNRTDGENSFGLWQINIAAGANPEYAGKDLFDPIINCLVAIQISQNGADWSPWSTYESGAYLAYLPGQDVPQPAVSSSQATAPGVAVTPGTGNTIADKNAVHLPEAWAMVAYAAGRESPQVWQNIVEVASHMRRVVR